MDREINGKVRLRTEKEKWWNSTTTLTKRKHSFKGLQLNLKVFKRYKQNKKTLSINYRVTNDVYLFSFSFFLIYMQMNIIFQKCKREMRNIRPLFMEIERKWQKHHLNIKRISEEPSRSHLIQRKNLFKTKTFMISLYTRKMNGLDIS